MGQIHQILRKLGIGARYQGFYYLSLAVWLVADDPTLLWRVTKELYPKIASTYKTSWQNVERAIRTIIDVCWEYGNREFLNEIAGYSLKIKPAAADFIDMLAYYCKKH